MSCCPTESESMFQTRTGSRPDRVHYCDGFQGPRVLSQLTNGFAEKLFTCIEMTNDDGDGDDSYLIHNVYIMDPTQQNMYNLTPELQSLVTDLKGLGGSECVNSDITHKITLHISNEPNKRIPYQSRFYDAIQLAKKTCKYFLFVTYEISKVNLKSWLVNCEQTEGNRYVASKDVFSVATVQGWIENDVELRKKLTIV